MSAIGAVTLVVADYDQAIDFFTTALGFRLVEETPLGTGKRWVLVAPSQSGASLLLAKAATPEQERSVGFSDVPLLRKVMSQITP